MTLWNVGIMAQSLTRKTVNSDQVAYKRTVRSETRRQAIEKCLPDILELIREIDPTIRYISVLCGRKGNTTGAASRLTPVQITRDGNFR